jgi:hypothetical protein
MADPGQTEAKSSGDGSVPTAAFLDYGIHYALNLCIKRITINRV